MAGRLQRKPFNEAVQNVILKAYCFSLFLRSVKMVAIAQLVRASDCDSEGRGFEPHWLPSQIPV